MDADNFAVVEPGERRALVVVAPWALRFPYYLRYELIEFAVQTLASRSGELCRYRGLPREAQSLRCWRSVTARTGNPPRAFRAHRRPRDGVGGQRVHRGARPEATASPNTASARRLAGRSRPQHRSRSAARADDTSSQWRLEYEIDLRRQFRSRAGRRASAQWFPEPASPAGAVLVAVSASAMLRRCARCNPMRWLRRRGRRSAQLARHGGIRTGVASTPRRRWLLCTLPVSGLT
jgi:hypothetical protein